ncbi:MAG: ATP-binding cassette domain-containing protein [Anaerolineales bacterium]|nr:ATP-binding cassette domain-containing protein [Anaerolineales bacterium]
MRSLFQMLRYLKRYWRTTIAAYTSLVLSSSALLVTPRMLQILIDQGIAEGNMSRILRFAVAMVGVALIGALFQFLQGFLSEKVSQSVAFDLRNELFAQIQRLSFGYHDRSQTGQLMTRATNDVELVRHFTGMGFLQMLNALVLLIGSLALLLSMNWRLALIVLMIVPFAFLLFGVFAARARPMFTVVQEKLSQLNTILQENLAGIRVVKAFATEPYEAKRFGEANVELRDQQMRVGRMIAAVMPLMFGIANLGTLAVVWLGGLQVIEEALTIGELVAFNTYLLLLMMPVGILGMILSMVSRAGASADRILEVLQAQVEVQDKHGARELPAIRGQVSFEDVSFSYFSSAGNVLEDVSFVAEPGQTLALLGATGSGKSTVINLIPRFYDVTQGRVTVDGYDIRDVTLESLRSQIGIVLQETTLFSGTIKDNIAFGRPDASNEEVIAAAQAAEAHEFISEFPDGYETWVGERGVTLSGGQKQRLAIARALLMDPRILILDDSTSSVDIVTEARIQNALEGLMEGRTSFIIAQRISTVRNADRIIVLEKGHVVAQGSHEVLLEISPIYADIYHSQLHDDGRPVPEPEKMSAADVLGPG